jgi:D-glycero-D-manno-heptose 1,7-bisphosphate phosphatase
MCKRFAEEGAPIARVYHCPFHPTEAVGDFRREHPWRKPLPGMMLQAAADFGLDLPGSALVGDKPSDIEAGAAAGMGLRVLLEPKGTAPLLHPGCETVSDLEEAAALLRARLGNRQSCASRG